jgi:hypothetical protein
MSKRYDKMVARVMRGTDYAVRVLKFQPERYDFLSIRLPKLNECACLIGFIGQGVRFGAIDSHNKKRRTIERVTNYIEGHLNDGACLSFDDQLYEEMDKLSKNALDEVNRDWHNSPKIAARYLKRAVAKVLKTYKPKAA